MYGLHCPELNVIFALSRGTRSSRAVSKWDHNPSRYSKSLIFIHLYGEIIIKFDFLLTYNKRNYRINIKLLTFNLCIQLV